MTLLLGQSARLDPESDQVARFLQFGLSPEIVRRPFAEIGDIRTFFDLVEKRAMAFVTYVSSLYCTPTPKERY